MISGLLHGPAVFWHPAGTTKWLMEQPIPRQGPSELYALAIAACDKNTDMSN
jgi:hypothetical protein